VATCRSKMATPMLEDMLSSPSFNINQWRSPMIINELVVACMPKNCFQKRILTILLILTFYFSTMRWLLMRVKGEVQCSK
jgi:hypothetical protein